MRRRDRRLDRLRFFEAMHGQPRMTSHGHARALPLEARGPLVCVAQLWDDSDTNGYQAKIAQVSSVVPSIPSRRSAPAFRRQCERRHRSSSTTRLHHAAGQLQLHEPIRDQEPDERPPVHRRSVEDGALVGMLVPWLDSAQALQASGCSRFAWQAQALRGAPWRGRPVMATKKRGSRGSRRSRRSRRGNAFPINGHWYVVWYGPEIKGGFLKRHVSRGFESHHDAQGLLNKMSPPNAPAQRQKRRPTGPSSFVTEWWKVGSPRADIVAGRRS